MMTKSNRATTSPSPSSPNDEISSPDDVISFSSNNENLTTTKVDSPAATPTAKKAKEAVAADLPKPTKLLFESQDLSTTRSLILRLVNYVGQTCGEFLVLMPLDGEQDTATTLNPSVKETLQVSLRRIVSTLIDIADSISINMEKAIRKKMMLNARKYPADKCKGRSEKYTAYTAVTGISKDVGQSTIAVEHDAVLLSIENNTSCSANDEFLTNKAVVHDLKCAIRLFSMERDWAVFHTPRNLLLALIGEMGELAEEFQFLGDQHHHDEHSNDEGDWFTKKRDKIAQEIADVSIYSLRLADVCGVELC